MGNTAKRTPAAQRIPRQDTLSVSTVWSYDSKCRTAIRRHHEEMKHDPDRLTTEFLIAITRCNCKLNRSRNPA